MGRVILRVRKKIEELIAKHESELEQLKLIVGRFKERREREARENCWHRRHRERQENFKLGDRDSKIWKMIYQLSWRP